MLQTLADIGIDAIMVLAIVAALSCLVYLVTISLREHSAVHRRQ
jgi:hypothetical protein